MVLGMAAAAAAAASAAAPSCQANPVGVVLENAPGNLASSVLLQPFKKSANQLIAYNKSFFSQQGGIYGLHKQTLAHTGP